MLLTSKHLFFPIDVYKKSFCAYRKIDLIKLLILLCVFALFCLESILLKCHVSCSILADLWISVDDKASMLFNLFLMF